MKFTILCDEKPKKCEDCPFWQSTLAKREDNENAFDIVSNCAISGISNEKCPLTVVNTIWDDEDEE